MLKKDIAPKFKLLGIKTEQFATFTEPTSNDVQMKVQIKLGANFPDNKIGVFMRFDYKTNDIVCGVIEVSLHFEFEPQYWDSITNKTTEIIQVPKDVISSLINITIGTTRGILFAKTDGTPFSKLQIPVMNPVELATSDFEIRK